MNHSSRYRIELHAKDGFYAAFGYIQGRHCVEAYGDDHLQTIKDCRFTMSDLVGGYDTLLRDLTLIYHPGFPHE